MPPYKERFGGEMYRKNFLLIILLLWAIFSTSCAVYFYTEAEKYRTLYNSIKDLVIEVNIGIDYSNGTIQWFNHTKLPLGCTLFNATARICDVKYYYGAYGVYVTSINGVEEKIIVPGKEGMSWVWFKYNATSGELEWGTVSTDKYVLNNGETIVWKYYHWKYP